MRKVLNVAEKPSVAKAIARVLSQQEFTQTVTSYSKYNHVYSFKQKFLDVDSDVFVTSVTGHIKELYFLPPHNNWGNRDPRALLKSAPIERRPAEGKEDLVKTLEKYAKESTDLFLWLDCDREGEAIAFDVIALCVSVNPKLQVHRATFSSIEQKEIQRAWERPGLPDANQSKAVMARQEIDLRSGYAFTQIQTDELRKSFRDAFEKVASYGPCQFPTLFFVVERYLLHTQFVPENYWSINAQVSKNNSTVNFNWERNRVFSELECAELFGAATKDFPRVEDIQGTITDVENKKSSMIKPLALTTVTFQKMAVNKLRITSDEAMGIAEKLYQAGYVSYPRTETNSYPEEFGFRPILRKLAEDPDYAEHIDQLLGDKGFQPPRQGKLSDKAHPPIHPIKAYSGSKGSMEYKVHDLISRTFIANCSRDAVTAVSNLKLNVGGERFTATGMTVLEPNYLTIFRKFAIVNEKSIPVFEKGEQVSLSHFVMKKSETTPPPLLNEADLISLMDKNGIGTDATMHEHIKTIQDRKYAQKVRQNFLPTQLGLSLFAGYKKVVPDLIDPLQRAKTEKNLQLISKGELDSAQFLSQSLNELEERFDLLNANMGTFLENFRETYNKFQDLEGKVLKEAAPEVLGPDGQPIPRFHSVDLTPCPQCKKGQLKAICSKKGFYFVSCSTRDCKLLFFADKVGAVKLSDQTCTNCGKPDVDLTKLNGSATLTYCSSYSCTRSFAKIMAAPWSATSSTPTSAAKYDGKKKPREASVARPTIARAMDKSKATKGTSRTRNENQNYGNKERSPNRFRDDASDDSDSATVKDEAKARRGKKAEKTAATSKGRVGKARATDYDPSQARTKVYDPSTATCFKCKTVGHYANRCPN